MKRQAFRHKLAKLDDGETISLAGDLDVSRMRRAIAAQNDRGPGHAFASDKSDFDAAAVRLFRDHGGDPGLRKADLLDPPIRAFQRVTEIERTHRQMRR
jgi:hypothetical protein